MTLYTASFEVSPSGTNIPLGGTDGFTSQVTGTGASFVSDSSQPQAVASGTLAALVSVGATSTTTWRGWEWTSGIVHMRQYIYLTALPRSRFSWWMNWNGSNQISRVRIDPTGVIGVGDMTTMAFTTAVLPLNTLIRVEASFNHAASTASIAIYDGNSTTAISGGTASATGLSYLASTITRVRSGIQSTLTNYSIRTDGWAVSDISQPGRLVTGSTITGVTPSVVASADGGTVTAVVGSTVTIDGETATVVVEGGNRPPPPEPPSGEVWPPDPYRDAIRAGGYALTYSLAATTAEGVPIEGASDLRPVGGSIVDTTKPGVRRTLNLQLAPEPGLYEKLAPTGTQLTAKATIRYLDRTTFDIPMGVFDVDSQRLSEGRGGLSLVAPDKWVRIKRADFVRPTASRWGALVVDQIALLIRGALGPTEEVIISSTSTEVVADQVWKKDRAKAITDLAAGIGAWVYADRNGVFTIADIPQIGESADWLLDASKSGVLTSLDRERNRTETFNVVSMVSTATSGQIFDLQVVWDWESDSPTYAGTHPVDHPETAGPFGIVPMTYETALPLTNDGAFRAGLAILSRVKGLASQVSLGTLPNPAAEAFQVMDVLPPRQRYDLDRVLERHVIDEITHSLSLDETQIDGRSTRAEPIGEPPV